MLGIAFLAGTLVFTDTIKRTFDDLFADIYADTDTYVRSRRASSSSDGQRAARPDPRVDRRHRARRPGVADAQGFVQGFAQIVDADGDAIGNPGPGRADVRHELRVRAR